MAGNWAATSPADAVRQQLGAARRPNSPVSSRPRCPADELMIVDGGETPGKDVAVAGARYDRIYSVENHIEQQRFDFRRGDAGALPQTSRVPAMMSWSVLSSCPSRDHANHGPETHRAGLHPSAPEIQACVESGADQSQALANLIDGIHEELDGVVTGLAIVFRQPRAREVAVCVAPPAEVRM